jgi:uncharacterized protein
VKANTDSDDFLKAIKTGDSKSVRKMLADNKRLADTRDQNGMSAVTIATYYNQPRIANALIDHGAKLDLFEASMVGKLVAVRNLVRKGQEVDSLSPDGFTALHLAGFFGHEDIAQFLLENGADANAQANNPTKVRPLHSAVAHRHFKISNMLVERGADVNARQQGGFTPLHEAAQGGSLRIAQLLLRHGADVNATTDRGDTALDLTSKDSREAGPKESREKVAQLLIKSGARRQTQRDTT